MNAALPTIVVLGANGLIGHGAAVGLRRLGFPVVGAARQFTRAQEAALGSSAVRCPVVSLTPDAWASHLLDWKADVVLNCIGVLQDSGRGGVADVHDAFIERLLAGLAACGQPTLLIHLSVPEGPGPDPTAFSRTKRTADRALQSSGCPFVIVRPGFVIAPAAYGGSALMRAMAMLPLRFGSREASTPFMATALADIVRTVAAVSRRWGQGEREWSATWDVMDLHRTSLGEVLLALRSHFGGPAARWAFPSRLMDHGARLGDLVSRLGWQPPIRSTAVEELRRGVSGDPGPWIAATGLSPLSLDEALALVPASVQERWFGRLYLLKALTIGSLALFWIVSGLVALTVSFVPARQILIDGGFSTSIATAATVVTGAADVGIGLAIAVRRTCKAGLLAGIALTLAYAAGALVVAQHLWLDPLGPLVKTFPIVVLMTAALAILDDR